MKTTFIDKQTVVEAEWLNEVNRSVFDAIGDGTDSPTTPAEVITNIGAVSTTGNQTIGGVKTFSSKPVLPATTPTGNEAASADYVDSVPRGPGFGGTLSNNTTDATNDIDVASGARWDSTYVNRITLAAMTKQLDADWAAGTNQGMRYSGAAIANTTYHIFAVWKEDGTQDYYAYPAVATESTVLAAFVAQTSDAAWIYICRLGSIVRRSGSIKGFVQYDKNFLWTAPELDISVSNPGTSAVTRTLIVPIGAPVIAHFSGRALGDGGGNTGSTYFSSLDSTDVAASATGVGLVHCGGSYTSGSDGMGQYLIKTNNSGQIRSRAQGSAAGTALYISTVGWIDYSLGGF